MSLWPLVLLELPLHPLVLLELLHDPGLLALPELLLLLLERLWHPGSQLHLVLQYFPWVDPEPLWLLELQRHLVLLSYPGRRFALQLLPGFLLLPGLRCFPVVLLEPPERLYHHRGLVLLELPLRLLGLPLPLVSLWLPVLLELPLHPLVLLELLRDPGLLELPELLLLLLELRWHLVCQLHLVLRYFPWEDPVLLRHLVLQRHPVLPGYPGRRFALLDFQFFLHRPLLLELLEHRFEHLELLGHLEHLVGLVNQ